MQSLIHWNYQWLSRKYGKTEPVLIPSLLLFDSQVRVQVCVSYAEFSASRVSLFLSPVPEKKPRSLYRPHSKNLKWCAGLDSGFPQLSWGFLLPHLPLLAFVWPCWAQPRPRVLLRLSEAGPVQGATCTKDPGSSPISSKQQHDDEIVWCRRNGKQNGLPAPFWSWSDTLEIGFPLLREVV